jgi:hypothetical protein
MIVNTSTTLVIFILSSTSKHILLFFTLNVGVFCYDISVFFKSWLETIRFLIAR